MTQVPTDDVQGADVDALQLLGHMLAPQRIVLLVQLHSFSSDEVYYESFEPDTPVSPATKNHRHDELEEMKKAMSSNSDIQVVAPSPENMGPGSAGLNAFCH